MIASFFSQKFRVTLIDFEGFGKSIMPNKPKTVADYTMDIYNLVKEKGLKNLIIIGHSFGGRIAIDFTYKFPKLVSKLILVDSAGLKPRRKLNYYYYILMYKIKKKLNLDISKYGSNDYKQLNNIMKQTFIKVVNFDQKFELFSINVPTLILYGKNDTETPIYMAKYFNKKIKNSRLVLLDNCGHFPFLEDTYNFINIVNKFLYE